MDVTELEKGRSGDGKEARTSIAQKRMAATGAPSSYSIAGQLFRKIDPGRLKARRRSLKRLSRRRRQTAASNH